MGAGPVAARAAAERAVARLCARTLPPDRLLEEAADVVQWALPCAAAGWMTSDPTTGLSTAIRGEQVDPDVQRRLIEHERSTLDINTFASLAGRRSPVARLSAATRGQPAASPRHRDLYAPLGLGMRSAGSSGPEGSAGGRCASAGPPTSLGSAAPRSGRWPGSPCHWGRRCGRRTS